MEDLVLEKFKFQKPLGRNYNGFAAMTPKPAIYAPMKSKNNIISLN